MSSHPKINVGLFHPPSASHESVHEIGRGTISSLINRLLPSVSRTPFADAVAAAVVVDVQVGLLHCFKACDKTSALVNNDP